MSVLADITLVMIFATAIAFVARYFNQPIIPAYLLAGLLLGPGLQWVTNAEVIYTISEIGAAFLLFLVGLEIDLRKLKRVSVVTIFGGLVQTILLFTIGLVVSIAFGFSSIEAAYLGIILAFSSTMLVVKLLSDKNELDTIHGRIILGFLLVEDLLAIIAMTILTTLSTFSVNILILSLTKVLIMILFSLTAAKLLLPSIFRFAAKSVDMLFLLAISICLGYALLFAELGFSIAIGAFVAGVSLATLPWNIEIISRVRSIRDFFATIFFVSLGLNLGITSSKSILLPLLVFLGIILVLKPFITQSIVQFFSYKRHTAFNCAACLTQTSEFSLIIASLGISLGHISQRVYTIAVLLAVLSMTLASYIISYRTSLFNKVKDVLPHLDRLSEGAEDMNYGQQDMKNHVVLCGYNRSGFYILQSLKRLKQIAYVVDYNPDVIHSLIREKQPCLYGDITDDEILQRLSLKQARMVISTAHNYYDNLKLLRAVKAGGSVPVILSADTVRDALDLYDQGADYVIIPYILGGTHVSMLLERFNNNLNNILKLRDPHIKELKKHHQVV